MRAALLLCALVATVAVVSASASTDLSEIELDLKHIKARVMREKGWSADHTDAVAEEYRRFWLLHLRHPDMYLVPSLDVDEIWHAHILFTQKYAEDCDRIFGAFLHHFPTVDEDATESEPITDAATVKNDAAPTDEKPSDYEAMLALYEKEFGIKPNGIWVRSESAKCCSAKCNSTIAVTAPAGCGSCGSKCPHKARAKKLGITLNSAGCGSCGSKAKETTAAGCGSGCGSKCSSKKAVGAGSAGCGSCGSKAKATDKPLRFRGTFPHGNTREVIRRARAAGCGSCGSKAKAVGNAAGCGNCSGKLASKPVAAGNAARNAAGCGNCSGKLAAKASNAGAAAGCGNCSGKVAAAAKKTAAVSNAAGCGNCSGKLAVKAANAGNAGNAAGCGNCSGKVAAKKAVRNAAGCGNCSGKVAAVAKTAVVQNAAGCGNCSGKLAAKKNAATQTQTTTPITIADQ